MSSELDQNIEPSNNMTVDEQQQRSTLALSSKQTKLIIILLAICNFFIANGVSLQGPFFPKEAEQKGATPLAYSSIFAIYELVMLVTSFIFGNFVERFKPNLMSGFGLTITGLSTAIFGMLDYIPEKTEFITIAFGLRIIESLGATAFATSSYSFISVCFPDQTATVFATMEMFFGLGVITGPVVGGFLYDLGGFLFPFIIIGVIITIFGIILISNSVEDLFQRGKLFKQIKTNEENRNTLINEHQILDNQQEVNVLIPNNESPDIADQNATIIRFLSSPIILIDSFIIITAIILIGFNGATLEPFIRHQGISNQTLHISIVFMTLGASYSFSAFIWGKICDKFLSLSIYFAMLGSIIIGVGLIFLSPIPFLHNIIQPNLWTICGCMILFGIGTSSKQVTAYTHALNYTIKHRKFPQNQKTYGYISGMFFFCISSGGFIGPIIGGMLIQWWNFAYATFIIFLLEFFVLIILLILQFCCLKLHI